ncbi:MAG: FAD-binding oxidoreductase [Mycobacterium sp.]
MGVEDQQALRTLRAAVTPGPAGYRVTGDFYTRWFAIDSAVRDLFPPDLDVQKSAFAHALHWLLGELAERRAEEPVAFLAQLGRDHRKYGVTKDHYRTMRTALHTTLRSQFADDWDTALDDATGQALDLFTGVMSGAAEAETGPPYVDGTVLETLRVTRDVLVVRLKLDRPLPFLPGQYVTVQVPQCPRRWRYLSPSIPPDPHGYIEFHVRSVPGGMVSNAIVSETTPGMRWRMSNPHGALEVDRNGGDVLMVAGSTGLAPLRAIVMDLARSAVNPRVHLFFGGRFPCELYDLQTLWEVATHNPWLSVTPVSEYTLDPPWAQDYPDVSPPRGLHVRQTGKLATVVTRFGAWSDRQILISGGPAMVQTTVAALIAKGAPPERIQHDPLSR